MIIMGKYKVTNRGWIVLACLILLIGVSSFSLLNNNEPIENNNGDENPSVKETQEQNQTDQTDKTKPTESESKEDDESKNELENTQETDDSTKSTEPGADEGTEQGTEEPSEPSTDTTIDYESIKTTVYFNPNQYLLDMSYETALNEIVEFAKGKSCQIVIEGNLNVYPNVEVYNGGEFISLKRAQVVKEFFLAAGFKDEEVLVIDNYDRKPLVKEGNYDEFKLNRRADIYLKAKE